MSKQIAFFDNVKSQKDKDLMIKMNSNKLRDEDPRPYADIEHETDIELQKFRDENEEHETGVADTISKVEMHYQNQELKQMEKMDINSTYIPKDESFYQGSRDATVVDLAEQEY